MGKIGGDTNLSARGRLYAAALARYFNETNIDGLHVWTSEKKRTKQTAQDINAAKEHISALNELDAVGAKLMLIERGFNLFDFVKFVLAISIDCDKI